MNRQTLIVLTAAVGLLGPAIAEGQGRGGRGGAGAAPPTARALAPIDLTGYWTAVITEDWHVRMLTAPKGDFGVGAPGVIENPGVGLLGVGPESGRAIEYSVQRGGRPGSHEMGSSEGRSRRRFLQGIWRARHHAPADASANRVAGRQYPEGRCRLRHPDPSFPFRSVDGPGGRMDFSNATYLPTEAVKFEPPPGVKPSRQGYSMAAWTIVAAFGKRRARRQPESRHPALDTGLLLEERDAVHGQRQAHRVLPRHGIARQESVAPVHTDRRRS